MSERRIDINRSNYSVIDNEFGNMRDRFEQEMRRVEDEMKRLRSEFEGYRPSGPSPAPTNQAYNSSHSSSHHESSRRQEGFGAPPPSSFGNSDLMSRPTYDPYLDNLKSPLIKDESDGKTLRLRFDVAQYKPEEVTVKTIDNRLLVHAKHEEKTPQRTVFREYNQEFLLPRGTNPEQISSTLSTDGVLTVEAPLPHLAIQH
ncbi:Hsp20/alpha crystallin family protein [Dictyocaulus viviparus]|uniref:Hsp20/alpha crystallin family protein n=1 Tax=Dictyocaulus viviparus TaxID=29172 RepID=A0A0D8XPI4_DICVI|nr:Hsp20/alpha crystallin family protein [Dictyocaulus viviparus]